MSGSSSASSKKRTRVLFLAWGFSIHAKRRIQIFVDDPSFEVAVYPDGPFGCYGSLDHGVFAYQGFYFAYLVRDIDFFFLFIEHDLPLI